MATVRRRDWPPVATELAVRRFGGLSCGIVALVLLGLGSALAQDGSRGGDPPASGRTPLPTKSQAKDDAESKSPPTSRRATRAKRSDRPATAAEPDRAQARMDECRQQIQSTLHPAQVIRLSEECARDLPAAPFAEELRRLGSGARQVLDIQRSAGLSADLFDDPVGDDDYHENLHKAVRGDKDAAYRIALAYRAGRSGVGASARRTEQWLRFSAELGNGLASWELAEFYNYRGLVADAARFEKKAAESGYRAPFRLPTRGY